MCNPILRRIWRHNASRKRVLKRLMEMDEDLPIPTSYRDWQRLSAWYGNAEMG